MSEQASSVHVEFFVEPKENKAKSLAEGRPIYEDVEFVRIKFPGDNKRVHVAPAHEGYRRDRENGNQWVTWVEDFPRHYEAFKKGMSQAVEGTPLSELPFLTESKRAELRALNIHTAEQLAGLDGTPLSRLGMGARELKRQAESYIAKATDSALEAKLSAENEAMRAQIEAMQAQVAELMKSAAAPSSSVANDKAAASPFATWSEEDLKSFIADRTGSRPRGNPSISTLIAKADELMASEAQIEEVA